MLSVLLDPTPLAKLLAEGPPRRGEIEHAMVAALANRHEDADEALRRAKEGGAPQRELALAGALMALRVGDAGRAWVAAGRLQEDPLARCLAADALAQLGRHEDARARLAGMDEHPYARVLLAELDVAASRPADALARLHREPREGVLGARARRAIAEAWLASDPPQPKAARDELSAAAWALVRLGATDEVGRCYLSMAEVEAAAGAPRDAASQWLARAHALFAKAGTPHDQARLRRAFRRHGRREIDRLVDASLEDVIEGARAEMHRVHDVRAAEREGHAGEIEATAGEALAALTTRIEQLIGTLEATLLERERTGQLVAVTRQIFVLDTEGALDRELPKLALQLGGDGAALFDVSQREARVVAAHGGRSIDPTRYPDAIRRARETDGVHLEDDPPDGELALVSIGRAELARILAVRQRRRRTGAGGGDEERLQVLASIALAAYERARHASAAREAAARDAATLEAIREGILTLDEEGTVRSLNGAAAVLLAIARDALLGQPLRAHTGMRPLAAAIDRAAEDEAVALPHADVLVRARHYVGGVVVTLQELTSARRQAHKLLGASARFTFDDLVGRDAAFLDTIGDARRVAASDVPILVTGESGTGKEMLAQAIHNASPHAAHPFVGVNVAAVPRELLESELFGYEAGAFTGARARGHPGRFELADRGTLLLDEIGDMPFEMQAKLLRVLQERTVYRLGGTRGIPIRARIIATTHRDLEQAVADGSFRLDLFYRLRVVHLRLPPLREREEDVRMLVERELARHVERSGRAPIRLAPSVLEDLERYQWPGNVRELANLVEGVASLLPTDAGEWTETPALIRRALAASVAPPPSTPVPGALEVGGDAIEPLEALERRAVARALSACDGNVAQAARALGVSRGTLYNKIARYGLR